MSNIFKMATREWDVVLTEIGDALKANESYKEYETKYKSVMETIDKKTMLEIDCNATGMETEAMEEGYSKGYADAVKIMTACLGSTYKDAQNGYKT